MNSAPLLVYADRPTQHDLCLKRLIEFYGLTCTSVPAASFSAELERGADHDLCVLASATSLDAWCQTFPDGIAALNELCRKTAYLFVYGFTPAVSHTCLAASLSAGAVLAVRNFTGKDVRYDVSSSHREITREFSGLSFGGVRSGIDSGFVRAGKLNGVVSLISVADMPIWLRLERNGCKIFLLACSAVADLQEEVSGNIDVGTYFSRLLPAAMFLRTAFAGRCWHNKHRFANFIIDDPPLKRSYGYLNYRHLVSTMDRVGFASTIAFIPWNYKRSDTEVTQLFRDRPDRLSLCVHGCDHTTAEFSCTDLALLNSRVHVASARMNSLNQRSGIPYSKVMVFPQGRFSVEALTALKANNYLAAVNSSAEPASSTAEIPVTLGDFLDVAISKRAGFPLYLRRYPDAVQQFAFDLFFGKPLLMVEHHAYLKDGGERLAEFVANINSLEKLHWTALQEMITRSYLQREVSKNVTACRLYTSHQIIENQAQNERSFILTKHEAGDVPIESVTINGQSTAFEVRGSELEFTIRVPARSSATVNIAYNNRLPAQPPGYSSASRVRIWTRRILSELRDTGVCWGKFKAATAQPRFRNAPGRATVTTAGSRRFLDLGDDD